MRRLLPLLLLPGMVLGLACPATVLADGATPAPGVVTADVAIGTEPLLPYVVALLVMSAVLMVVGIVAILVTRRPTGAAGGRGQPAWWTCATCGSRNTDDRTTCYGCAAGRAP